MQLRGKGSWCLLAFLAVAGSALAVQPRANLYGMQAAPQVKAAMPSHYSGAPLLAQRRARSGVYAKLDSTLLRAAVAAALPPSVQRQFVSPHSPARTRLLAPSAVPQIMVDVTVTGNPGQMRASLESLGMQSAVVFRNDVGGWMPADQIANAAALPGVRAMRASLKRTRTGSATSQGDFVQGSLALRQSFVTSGLDGRGITVGILSDTFDCLRGGYAENVSSGDLPADVNIVKDDAFCAGRDEGRALAQVVRDVAPGASLAFYTANESEADFANGILTLATPRGQSGPTGLPGAGAQVIVDDVGYFDEPVFQDGILAQAVDQVVAQGVLYFSAAGNGGRNSYVNANAQFTTPDNSDTSLVGDLDLNFDNSGATTTPYLPITIPALDPGDFRVVEVFWDQPYLTGAPNSGGATGEIDACFGDANGVPLPDSADPGNGLTVFCTLGAAGGDPFDLIAVENDGSSTTDPIQASIVVGFFQGEAPQRVKLIVDQDITIDQFATNSATIQGHPGAAGAVAVGAAFYLETPPCGTTPALLESYSAAGGEPILFDVDGNRLGTPVVRQKPQLVAPDGVHTTFFGQFFQTLDLTPADCSVNGSLPLFFGTSTAAPHAAGVAALLLQASPAAAPADLYDVMQQSALDMGAPGPDFDTGFGLVQANETAERALAAQLPLLPPPPPPPPPAQLTVNPSSISLSTTISATGFSSGASQVVTLANAGGQPLKLLNIALAQSTPGLTESSGCPASLNAGAHCTVKLSYLPAAAGSTSNMLVIATDAPNASDGKVTAPVTASASPPPGSGGGGSVDWLVLLALSTAAARRRRGSRP